MLLDKMALLLTGFVVHRVRSVRWRHLIHSGMVVLCGFLTDILSDFLMAEEVTAA